MAYHTIHDIAVIENPDSDDNAVGVSVVKVTGSNFPSYIGLDVRSLWWPEDADGFINTKKGFTLRSEEEVTELITALREGLKQFKAETAKPAPKRTRKTIRVNSTR